MASDAQAVVVGGLTDDPQLRFTQSGQAVAGFTVAQTPRKKNAQTNQWEDGETLFMRCTVWGEFAENVANSLTKGARVIVSGRLVSRTFQDREGNQRTSVEMQVEEMGPSLRWATAQVNRVQRQQGGNQQQGYQQQGQQQGYQQQGQGQPQGQQYQQQVPDDPWGQPPY